MGKLVAQSPEMPKYSLPSPLAQQASRRLRSEVSAACGVLSMAAFQTCTSRESRPRLARWTLRRSQSQRGFFEPCVQMNSVDRDAAPKRSASRSLGQASFGRCNFRVAMDLGLANGWRHEIANLYRALEAVYPARLR